MCVPPSAFLFPVAGLWRGSWGLTAGHTGRPRDAEVAGSPAQDGPRPGGVVGLERCATQPSLGKLPGVAYPPQFPRDQAQASLPFA